MKKKIIFLLLLLMPIYVHADSIILNCPKEVALNGEFTCELSGTSTKGITSISARASATNADLVEFSTKNTVWQGDGDGGHIELYNDVAPSNPFKIGTIKFKNKSNGPMTVTVNEVSFFDDSEKEITISAISKTVTIKQQNTNTGTTNNNTGNTNTNTNTTK